MAREDSASLRKLAAYPVYLIISGTSSLLFSMIFTASEVYKITVVHLAPLQLVLLGTALELTVFFFEVPTGVVADVYSRRMSVIIGWLIIGLGFFLQGTFPVFWVLVFGEMLYGFGYTFTSGATQAWITDEIGEAAAGRAFMRANQVEQITSLIGIGIGMVVGNLRVNIPLQLGGLCLAGIGLFLILFMPETGFKPTLRGDRNSWQNMLHTFRAGTDTIRRRPALASILTIGFIYGLFSEGYDRLWTKHILDHFSFPVIANWQPVVWFGLIRAIGKILSIGSVEIASRKISIENSSSIVRALLAVTLVLFVALLMFSLAPTLAIAAVCVWLIAMARNVIDPIYTAWVNQRLDSQVRATVLSMSSQVDAIGQIAGGPLVGLIGNLLSVRAALVTSGLILTPATALYWRLSRKSIPQTRGGQE